MPDSSNANRSPTIASPDVILTRLGRTQETVTRLANAHIQAVQAWLSTRTPQAERFEGVGVTANSSGLEVPLLNLALGSYYPLGTSDEVIEREIETVKTFYAYRHVPWSWWIGPNPSPSDMPQRLARHGLKYQLRPTMAAPLPIGRHSINREIRVWRASTPHDLEVASSIRRTAFRFPEGVAQSYFETMASDWLDSPRAQIYLASTPNGPPASIGMLIMGADLPGIYAMATLPEWRCYGLGSALLARMLMDAAEKHNIIFLTASRMGYALYRKFGFEHIFNFMDFGPFHSNNGYASASFDSQFVLPKPVERRKRRDPNYRGVERRRVVSVNSSHSS